MQNLEIVYLIFFILLLSISSLLLGRLIYQILEEKVKKIWGESFIYRFLNVNPDEPMSVMEYFKPFLWMHVLGFISLFLILTLQHHLPLNPQHFPGLSWELAFNTTASFVTNTNWQAYSGEASLSYFSQTVGLTVQNFLSASLGICVLLVIARSLVQVESDKVGNFWKDFTRLNLYILLPLSFIVAVLLMSQGVIQNFSSYVNYEGLSGTNSVLPMGPAATQIAIKQLGTNGGGFFGVNSAHPFENPTSFSNLIQVLSILLLPASLIFTFGHIIKKRKHGISLYIAVLLLFVLSLSISYWSEIRELPQWLAANWEGKEFRFHQAESILWASATTVASNGSVNTMHSSLSPIAQLMVLFNMLTGEVIFGGVGSGLYGLILYVIITVFLVGLMVGRSPEYLGKKIETKEVFWSALGILSPSIVILVGTSLALNYSWGLKSLMHGGPHGLSEMLYGFASTVGNNGSAFGGLNANTSVLNILFGLNMIFGRFVVIIPIFKIAQSLSMKKIIPESGGTFPTHGLLFIALLVFIIFIIGALTFFPALTLGPISEYIMMNLNLVI